MIPWQYWSGTTGKSLENWLIFWGIWGEAELNLGISGAKAKYFQGAEAIIFMDLGR